MKYWSDKIDKPTEADLESINRIFKSEAHYNEAQEILAAEIILQHCKAFQSEEEAVAAMIFTEDVDNRFFVDRLFCKPGGTFISTWRYDYKLFLSAIPARQANIAIKNIYARLGYDLTEGEIEQVRKSDNLYSKFLAELKTSGCFLTIPKEYPAEADKIMANFLNEFIFFGKLGWEGMNPYQMLAQCGVHTRPVGDFQYNIISRYYDDAVTLARYKSRGRMYPTRSEFKVLMEAETY